MAKIDIWLGSFVSNLLGIFFPTIFELYKQLVKICLQCGRPGFSPWVGKIPWRREKLPTPVFWPGEFHGHGVSKSPTGLSNFHFHFIWFPSHKMHPYDFFYSPCPFILHPLSQSRKPFLLVFDIHSLLFLEKYNKYVSFPPFLTQKVA